MLILYIVQDNAEWGHIYREHNATCKAHLKIHFLPFGTVIRVLETLSIFLGNVSVSIPFAHGPSLRIRVIFKT